MAAPTLGLLSRLYAAAAQAGLLRRCSRLSVHPHASSDSPPDVWVAFSEADETLLDGLAVAADPSIRFPANALAGLKKGELLEIDGAHYRVRDVRAIGDGSEKRAHLSRASTPSNTVS